MPVEDVLWLWDTLPDSLLVTLPLGVPVSDGDRLPLALCVRESVALVDCV